VKPVEYFFVLGGYLAYEGSPLWWAAIHRAHHKYVDTKLDPHSPRFGLLHSYFGWLFELSYPPHIDPHTQCKDLAADPIYTFLECRGNLQAMNFLCLGSNMAFRGIIWALFGWQAALASLLASFAVMQIPLLLNVVCHIPKAGYKTFAMEDDSVNVWWIGLFGFGEGWHNNHHAYPGSARNGMLPHEVDFSWLTIKGLQKLGLVSWLNPGPDMKTVSRVKVWPTHPEAGPITANKIAAEPVKELVTNSKR